MRVVSLFTGAGGLDLGLKQAGHEVILQCEHDPGAQQVLRHNFPGILLVNDVCGLESLPKGTDLLAAGFPCIDISRAGLRKGFQGQSSGLVQHVFRLLENAVDHHHPVPWVLLENVEALLDRAPNGGVPFVKYITDSLEALGYQSWAHRVIGSAGFGVPNRRTRVFILASLHGDARDVLLAQGQQPCVGSCCPDGFHDQNALPCYECYQEKIKWKTAKEASFALDLGNARSAPGVDVVPTFTTSNDRMCLLLSSGRMGMLRIEDAERLQGFPVGFTKKCYPIHPPGLNSHKQRPVKDSEVDIWESKRFALLGNAVTVQVGRWVGERLAAPYSQKYVPSDRDMPVIAEFKNQHQKANIKASTLYDGLIGEFEPMDGGLLVRGKKPSVSAGFMKDIEVGDGGSEKQSTMPVEASNQTMRKEFYGRKEMQSDAWPRAAWYIQGMGRFGVEEMSESPVKFPYTPLGPFISEVGKLPGRDVINTYIMRLREQGWNVEGVIHKATKCGVSLEKEVSSVVRLEGAPDDPEQVSSLVWTQCPVSKMPWPAEMLDPLNMPPSRSLPSQAVEKLTRKQKQLWLPREFWDTEDAIGGDLAFGALESQSKNPSGGNDDEDRRKVLVIFFGDNCYKWVLPEDVVDFADHLPQKEAEARKLHQAGLMKRPTLFFRALDEANTWLTVKKRKRTRGAKYVSAVSARAAQLAAAENKKPRCGNCEACLNRHSGGLQRRCLTVRAHAAAMGGHAGAQLSVYRERAIGARVHVYWPLDQQWYTGTLTDYDRIRLRHTVTYDDGDREMIPLWSPCQLIRVLNKPKEWQAKAVEIDIEAEKAKALQKAKNMQKKEMETAEEPPLTQLEMDREANIRRNKEILESLMGEPTTKNKSDSSSADVEKPFPSEEKSRQEEDNESPSVEKGSSPGGGDSGNLSEQTTRVGLKRRRGSDESDDDVTDGNGRPKLDPESQKAD